MPSQPLPPAPPLDAEPAAAPPPGRSGRDRSFWGVLLAALVVSWAVGLLQLRLSMLAIGMPLDWRGLLGTRALTAATSLAYLPLLAWIRRRWPAGRVGWGPWLGAIALSLAGFVVAQQLALPALQRWLLPPDVVQRASPVAKAIGEFLTLGSAVGLATIVELDRRLRARESEAARLEARLAEARLQALALRLQPHFLFNTLTAISVLVHRDPAAADAMLTRLADLLRATLRRRSAALVTLREELALLDRYLDIMRLRYGPRLVVSRRVPESLGDHLVPPFLLQPLVENALEHGVARRAGAGTVAIEAALQDGALRLTVTDDGPGVTARDGAGAGEGIGLDTTRRRLQELYGDDQRLTLEPAPGGGTRAVVSLPARRAAEPAAARQEAGAG
ncbi:MAG TPA: histidine kinase [Gemmatimonadales bacterium]|nr:histidine kinase [Gemmatimonadales bacterium]